jgi:hypothetical protein
MIDCGASAMRSLLLNSILIATVLIPIWAARDPHPRRGLMRALVGLWLYNVVYAFACAYVWARLPF